MSHAQTLAIEPKHLHAAWPFLRRGLESIVRKTKPEWLVEDVYSTLRTGGAQALVSYADETPIGFTIFYCADIPWSGKRELFVWAAWTIPPAERPTGLDVEGAVLHNWLTMEAIARREGCTRLACLSPRPGFAKFAERFGMKQSLVTYSKYL